MVLGMSVETFTFVHVVISMVGIMTGFVVVGLMLQSAPIAGWNAFFLISTILTSVTGYFFPITKGLTPAHVVGAISLIVLAVALYAIYGRKLAGRWRGVYIGTAIFALYLNVFVGVVQAFLKQPFLQPLAPTQSEPPFVIAQGAVLLIFLVLGVLAVRAFRPAERTGRLTPA
jgi:hypothetical protein